MPWELYTYLKISFLYLLSALIIFVELRVRSQGVFLDQLGTHVSVKSLIITEHRVREDKIACIQKPEMEAYWKMGCDHNKKSHSTVFIYQKILLTIFIIFTLGQFFLTSTCTGVFWKWTPGFGAYTKVIKFGIWSSLILNIIFQNKAIMNELRGVSYAAKVNWTRN